MTKTTNELGNIGEELSVIYIQNKGYDILDKNWRYGRYEIDIIALKADILVFIEVKTRTSKAVGEPESFVSKKKIENMIKAANAYCSKNNITYEIRFDIISVIYSQTQPEIKHIENAFYHF